jgi:acyl carrier protein
LNQQSSSNEIERDVPSVIATYFKVSPERITSATRFDADLAADSLSLVELLFAIQQQTKIKIPDDFPTDFMTVGELIDLVKALLALPADH